MPQQANQADLHLRRAHLPEVLFAEDLERVLDHVPASRIQHGMRAAFFGPVFFVDGLPAVLRADFIETMRRRAAQRARPAREVFQREEGVS